MRFSNALFFDIQRHADHHAQPQRPFYDLRHLAEAPQLPAGYPLMMFIALVPPLWFAVMDPRVAAARGGGAGHAAGAVGGR